MFDAIIVGARCAGSATGMLLARQGHRVLLVDKTRFPSDTLSTHFLWPRGASYLNRWALLEPLLASLPSGQELQLTIEDVTLRGSVPLPLIEQRFRAVHGDATGVVQRYCSPRRKVLDALLSDAAAASGAELRTGVTVEGLLEEDGRVCGIRGRTENGTPFVERAQVVIGADGRNSLVAREVGSEKYDLKHRCSFAYFSYFSGFSFGEARLYKRGRFGLALVPTHGGANMTLVWGPHDWFDAFLADAEKHFFWIADYVAPEVGELLRTRGHREEKFYGTADQAGYYRRSHGPGWALAGDAACFKDQCTAMGMTHAFRDAELLSSAVHEALAGGAPMDRALEDYQWRRNRDSTSYTDFVGVQAEMNPARPDEVELFLDLQQSQEHTDRFLAAYGDTLPISDFFSISNLERIRRASSVRWDEHPRAADSERRWADAFVNPFVGTQPDRQTTISLARTSFDFARPPGRDLLRRTEGYLNWMHTRRETGTWQYTRALQTSAGPHAAIRDESGRTARGLNFASQDYLGLNEHPRIREAALTALHDFGPHSAGSPMLIGNTRISQALESELAELLQMEHVTLYPTGWGAGFGAVTALVRPTDHILLDKLAHACLQVGAHAATKHVKRHVHAHLESAREHLRTIRAKDTRNGILVVTEGLFSMDSDCPDLAALQDLCHEYDATLLVDVAHDLGAMGPGGGGQLAVQKMLGKVDIVMGSFSKTFVSNGGFVASRSEAVKQYVKMFAGPHTFSNALSPVQAAVVFEACRIVRSGEGDALRARLFAAIDALRSGIGAGGMTCMGEPSPIVPVWIGDERQLRLMHRLLFERNVNVNAVEPPGVAAGSARFRLQVMASHTAEQATTAARALVEAAADAKAILAGTAPSGRAVSA